ncbi:MAG: hypothetical protein R3326_00435 [Gemmatimonadota bacterium]|nr:hypothetical protein [Gemmatimonadota bacterium]
MTEVHHHHHQDPPSSSNGGGEANTGVYAILIIIVILVLGGVLYVAGVFGPARAADDKELEADIRIEQPETREVEVPDEIRIEAPEIDVPDTVRVVD